MFVAGRVGKQTTVKVLDDSTTVVVAVEMHGFAATLSQTKIVVEESRDGQRSVVEASRDILAVFAEVLCSNPKVG